ncbi:trigger factor [Rhodoplanes elegans]|uniref:Trigger factor n=1 Tax=Rhodoplanes elegans TaxID=29408 RepID=A0A327KAU1_9BRAD|nr:trigger factor [Rhodoplanes elegans]MBK5956990.1 trigger factor [Rhodoplanes elegans]RAI35056.1 trigger factor [Rhodoplanes elegans]
MDVTQTTAEGLKREFRVVVPAADLETRLNDRLVRLKDQVRLNGFRPGKVPVAHLRKLYGRAVMAEAIEELVRETNAKIVTDNGFKLAMDPQVKMPEDKAEIEAVVDGKNDLAYTVALEVVPAIELADFKGVSLERLVVEVGPEEIQEALKRLADGNKPFSPKPEGSAGETGDRLTISFVGRIGGEPFEGGTGEDIQLVIGSGQFIPGFEDQLLGAKAGDTRTVSVTFPENYLAEKLAGKAAEFDVTVKSVEAPGEVAIDDDFAKKLGLESLAKLEEAIAERIKADYTAQSRQKLKRQLLDKLDELHKFEPPPTLVDEEFKAVWETVLSDLKTQNRTFADEGTDEEKARAEYRGIADRRVRLGLVLAEIGEKNAIKVTDEEISRAIIERARQYPGQEQQVWDFYRKNPGALASVRAPIFEEKVVDYILELATVTDRTVPKDELFKDDEQAAA